MKVSDVVDFMEKTAPIELAEKWDSPGLKTGSLQSKANKILICLDASALVVQEAVDKKCDMIISHHPILFHPVSYLSMDTEKALCLAIKNDISIYSAHTNLDFTIGGINDSLADIIGLQDIKKDKSGKHAYGYLKSPMTLNEFTENIKKSLNAPAITAVVPSHLNDKNDIYKVGVSSGGFDENYKWAEALNIDALVTGEIKHFEYVTLNEANLISIGAGHYFTEIPGMRVLCERLNSLGFNSIMSEREINPYKFY